MSSPDQTATPKPVSTWRKVFAAILDFIFIFAISGYVVASITGNTTEQGFDKGGPAFIVFAIIILYFILFTRYLGGTIFQRLLRAR
jgi:RDD family